MNRSLALSLAFFCYYKGMPKYDEILDDLNVFYKKLLVPYMRIRRDMPFPEEPWRMETDGEHAFSLAMVAISLNERLNLRLDAGKIAMYALTHDLVEVHAGDLSVKADESDHAQKAAREEEAYKIIEQDFAEIFPWVHKIIAEYEAKSDKESQFVYAVDKYMGALGWLAGEGKNWSKYYPQKNGELYNTVLERLRVKVKLFHRGEILELFDAIHDRLEKKREKYFKQSAITRENVRVGLAVFVVKPDKSFVILKRRGAHGEGTWGLPGGHLEFGETWEECAVREVKEETGLDITDAQYLTTTNSIFEAEGKHYITIWMKAAWPNQTAVICEPEKCSELAWATRSTLPQNLFLPLEELDLGEIEL